MIRIIVATALLITSLSTWAQNNGAMITMPNENDFQLTRYERDSSARAVVLHEFGEAYINTETFKLIFEHHIKIKILKKEGLDQSDFAIQLFKTSSKSEKLNWVTAVTYNLENNQIKGREVEPSKVYTENFDKNWDVKKFSLPNVKVGSVIKVSYEIESPFIYNFRNFEFQSDIPKVLSEFWAKIPGNYVYNITLKGFQRLNKNENFIVSNCIQSGGGGYAPGSYGADCVQYKFAMKNVPAFYEEDYMTARKNFISAIHFELSEVKYFDGRVDKVTKTWKDAEIELKREEKFGGQLKKGKDIGKKLEEVLAGVTDPTEKARKIYSFIQTWFKWNEVNGFFCDAGVKKSFESRTGNVADINLSLVAAMKNADLNAEPVLVSTRNNGLVSEIYPVLSDFNYVIAKVTIDGNSYLLDATDPYLPFGMLPVRCLNGKGRVFGEDGSSWQDLMPTEKYKQATLLTLTLQPTGVFTGTIEDKQSGYEAFKKRKKILSFNNQEEYLEELKKGLDEITIKKYEVTGLSDLNAPIIEKYEVEIEGFNGLEKDNLLLNPFFVGKIEKNPFRSNERLYPVDYGVPVENSIVVAITYPPTIEWISAPENTNFSLPYAGGKFMYEATSMGNKIVVNYLFSINKSVFNSNEYGSLKEFYNRIIEIQKTDFLFKKK